MKRAIGLLGGSFNPAHSGHVHLSREAMRRLDLKEVWWLVSPGNPLKPTRGMASFAERVAMAKSLLQDEKHICVSTLEETFATRYTVDTLRELQKHYPHERFVWLMGADNLAQLNRWRNWKKLLSLVPVAVFDRAPFSHAALRAPAALYLKKHQTPTSNLLKKNGKLPIWCYVFMPRAHISATDIRDGKIPNQAKILGN